MWPMVNSSPCREQNTGTALQARGASGCEGIASSGLLRPGWEWISLGQGQVQAPGPLQCVCPR